MSKYKCVIFDCDGVLVDSEPLSNQVMVDLANKYGANININYAYQYFVGNSLQKCQALIEGIIGKPLPTNFEEEYRSLVYEKFKTDLKPIEGIYDVLQHLKLPFCVASSGPVEKIHLNLKLTNLFSYFENKIFSCYTIKKWKPDPSVFLWAAKTMGFKPNECVVIEDSDIGVKAAIDGGFNVLKFGETAKTSTINTFSNMKDLLALIQ